MGIRFPVRHRRRRTTLASVLAGVAALATITTGACGPSGALAAAAPRDRTAATTTAVTTTAVPSKPAIYQNRFWYLRNTLTSGPANSTFAYGPASSIFPVMGDWNGDGRKTVGIVAVDRATERLIWFLRDSNSAGPATVAPFVFGHREFGAVDRLVSIPVVGDWNGDGRDTVGVVYLNASGGPRWELRNSNTGGAANIVVRFGGAFDYPVVGDWNGDGTDTVGMHRRPGRWLLRNANSTGTANLDFRYGSSNPSILELPVVGDWNGDGRDTPGVLRNRPATDVDGGYENWLLRNSATPGPANISFVYGGDSFGLAPPIDFVDRPVWK